MFRRVDYNFVDEWNLPVQSRAQPRYDKTHFLLYVISVRFIGIVAKQ